MQFSESVKRCPRQVAFGAALAILISYNACLTLGFGLFGLHGNSVTSGLLLCILLTSLFFLSHTSVFRVQLPDIIFGGLVAAVLISSLTNPLEASTKEHLLLAATLASYAACRMMAADEASLVRSAFERVVAIIVLTGAVFTAIEIFNEWDGPPGKPFVFGFNAAGTYFMTALGFLVLSLVSVDVPRRDRTILICTLIFLPFVIFAAAMVRFTFIALAGSLLVAMITTDRGKRWHIAAVGLTMLLAVAVGLAARSSTATIYAGYILEQPVETREGGPDGPGAPRAPSCRLKVNTRNSIAIRQVLAKDAVYLIPQSGIVGTGLDSFMRFSCIKAHQVHISILQAAVEFGWLGGALFVLLICTALYRLVPPARHSGAIRFILCSVTFAALLTLAHGRISRDTALFALLGCAVGVSRGILRPSVGPVEPA